jgi:hypothetical protein
VDEELVLLDQMALMAGFPEVRRQVGGLGAAHIRIAHSLGSAARQYWQVIDSTVREPAGLTYTP